MVQSFAMITYESMIINQILRLIMLYKILRQVITTLIKIRHLNSLKKLLKHKTMIYYSTMIITFMNHDVDHGLKKLIKIILMEKKIKLIGPILT